MRLLSPPFLHTSYVDLRSTRRPDWTAQRRGEQANGLAALGGWAQEAQNAKAEAEAARAELDDLSMTLNAERKIREEYISRTEATASDGFQP